VWHSAPVGACFLQKKTLIFLLASAFKPLGHGRFSEIPKRKRAIPLAAIKFKDQRATKVNRKFREQ
jgi:hypothetical protein